MNLPRVIGAANRKRVQRRVLVEILFHLVAEANGVDVLVAAQGHSIVGFLCFIFLKR